MNLSNPKEVKKLLSEQGFSFKKSLGQNFLIDPSVCPAMADAACAENTGVLEIGPGAGVLTCELCKRAAKVVAVELDERLKPILQKSLAEFNNVEVVFGDVMKIDLEKLIIDKFSDCEHVTVCANLPYYITSPIVMMLLESRLPIESVTVMVQKEAAERLCAEVGSRLSGAVTVAVNYYCESEILFGVPRDGFIPPPKVDSAVIKLNIRKTPPVTVKNEQHFFALAKACFAQRRKTLVNTVSSTLGCDREKLREALLKIGLEPTVRGEQLTMQQLAQLSDLI